ncbi:response regulator [Paenibacillus sp. GCM10027626]|uniref:response regulator transcription factor n=1 Tax=Paenibacillus sp. GCM10027626 TaxID=3273411 RepID=UPI0036379D0D
MYKVLIVDDEPFILDGLPYVIDWEEHGAEIAATARSGEEALAILERQTIHIVMTDIKMPSMDGLQLIETARSRGMNVKFIVLSGYDEFELVKKAVVYGVENYLLKPLEEEELSDTLLTTIEKLDHEVHLSIQNKQNYSIVKENILYRWVSGQIGHEELVSRAEFLHIDLAYEHFQVGVVHLLPRPDAAGDVPDPLKGPLSYAILNICGETIGSCGNCLPFSGINGVPILLFAWNGGDAPDPQQLAALLERCADNVRTYLKLEVAISLGTVEQDYRSVQHSYRAACNKLDRDGLAATGPSASIADDAHPAIMKVIEYIDEHYSQEMSLKTLSHHFNMNAAYLGQLFKKATGDMFSNYLNRIRIEKAKQLLAESQLKASEIASAVGFSNLQYFSNVFFKYTGFYPTDFKKQQLQS